MISLNLKMAYWMFVSFNGKRSIWPTNKCITCSCISLCINKIVATNFVLYKWNSVTFGTEYIMYISKVVWLILFCFRFLQWGLPDSKKWRNKEIPKVPVKWTRIILFSQLNENNLGTVDYCKDSRACSQLD